VLTTTEARAFRGFCLRCARPSLPSFQISETLIAPIYRQLDLNQRCTFFRLVEARLRQLAGRLNDTLRRCLGYRTPRGVFEQPLVVPTGPP
jgi:hypothetical protein